MGFGFRGVPFLWGGGKGGGQGPPAPPAPAMKPARVRPGHREFEKQKPCFSSKNRLGQPPTSVQRDRLSPESANVACAIETFPIVPNGPRVETGGTTQA